MHLWVALLVLVLRRGRRVIDLGKDRLALAMLSRRALPRERIGFQILHMYTPHI